MRFDRSLFGQGSWEKEVASKECFPISSSDNSVKSVEFEDLGVKLLKTGSVSSAIGRTRRAGIFFDISF